MRILIFHPYIKSHGGGERLLLEYVKRTKFRVDILTYVYIPEKTFEEFRNYNIIQLLNVPESISRSYIKRGIIFGLHSFFVGFPKIIDKSYDTILLSTSGLAELSLIKRKPSVPVLAYVHTILRPAISIDYKWNLLYRFNSFPKNYIFKLAVTGYRFLEKLGWQNIDYAIFNSKLSRARALSKKLISREQSTIVYPAVEPREFKNLGEENFFLYVARYNLTKRQDVLIKAFARFARKYKDYKLILVGSLENEKFYKHLQKLVKEYKLQNKVELLHNVPDKMLRELYGKCLAFIHIPFMEDFGIVPFEAAAAGKFIINTYPSGNWELLYNAPGILWVRDQLYKEKLIDLVYKALIEFVKNEDKYIEKGKENRKFVKKRKISWDEFAKKLDAVIEEQINIFK